MNVFQVGRDICSCFILGIVNTTQVRRQNALVGVAAKVNDGDNIKEHSKGEISYIYSIEK